MLFSPPLLDLQLVRKQCLYNQDRDLAQGVRSGIPHLQAGLPLQPPMPSKPEWKHFGRKRAKVHRPDYPRPSPFLQPKSVLATEHAPI